VIQVEAGNFLRDCTGYLPYVMVQNDQVASAYDRWPVEVINLGRFDLIWARKMLEREGLAQRLASLPMLKRLISANGVFESTVAASSPYLIKEVAGPRIPKRTKLKVAFIGLAEPIKPAEGIDATVTDMFKAARRAALKVRKLSDLVVIVAHAEYDAALRLARENPEADVVIAGNSEGVFNPRNVGNTLVVCAAPGNTQQGDLRVYIGGGSRFSFKFRSTDLDAIVPSDPAALSYTERARQELDRLRSR
jgi:2',3'-cyclic-nucleotide 2'-phosphodiesterase (5'-nucleotidase family)